MIAGVLLEASRVWLMQPSVDYILFVVPLPVLVAQELLVGS
jgi:hypothetical protein